MANFDVKDSAAKSLGTFLIFVGIIAAILGIYVLIEGSEMQGLSAIWVLSAGIGAVFMGTALRTLGQIYEVLVDMHSFLTGFRSFDKKDQDKKSLEPPPVTLS